MSSPSASFSGLTIRPATSADVPTTRDFMLKIFEQDYGYGYQPRWHWDYDDLQGVYLDNPRHTLILAVDDATGEIVGTAAIRAGGPTAATLPRWLVERYQPPEQTAQIVRVFIDASYRRRGLARLLVDALRVCVRDIGGYRSICLHTDSAVAFWSALPTRIVYDGRQATPPDGTVHFEMDLLPSTEGTTSA